MLCWTYVFPASSSKYSIVLQGLEVILVKHSTNPINDVYCKFIIVRQNSNLTIDGIQRMKMGIFYPRREVQGNAIANNESKTEVVPSSNDETTNAETGF